MACLEWPGPSRRQSPTIRPVSCLARSSESQEDRHGSSPSTPSPTCLHDRGRIEWTARDAKRRLDSCKSLMEKSLVPQVLRHQPVRKWAETGSSPADIRQP